MIGYNFNKKVKINPYPGLWLKYIAAAKAKHPKSCPFQRQIDATNFVKIFEKKGTYPLNIESYIPDSPKEIAAQKKDRETAISRRRDLNR